MTKVIIPYAVGRRRPFMPTLRVNPYAHGDDTDREGKKRPTPAAYTTAPDRHSAMIRSESKSAIKNGGMAL
ncbi:hypothetical protein Ssi03_49610 [Sphaerisporangium siamense]|nr:hypothetical protein Ssi03_49610 [Sphaerisporangium siamense]